MIESNFKRVCQEIWQLCPVCNGYMQACFVHDEYYNCVECGIRILINKDDIKKRSDRLLKKVFGAKPAHPENN